MAILKRSFPLTDKIFFQEISQAQGGYLEKIQGTSRYGYENKPAFSTQYDFFEDFQSRGQVLGNSLDIFDFDTLTWILRKEAQANIFYSPAYFFKGLLAFFRLDLGSFQASVYHLDPEIGQEKEICRLDLGKDLKLFYDLLGPELTFYALEDLEEGQIFHLFYPFKSSFFLKNNESLEYFDGEFFYGSAWHEEELKGPDYRCYNHFQVRDKTGQVIFEKLGTPYLSPKGDYILL